MKQLSRIELHISERVLRWFSWEYRGQWKYRGD